jgi:hypothetical protein
MEKPLGFSDAVASGSIKRISSFFIYMGFKSVDWIKVIKIKSRRNRFGGTLFHFYLNVAT